MDPLTNPVYMAFAAIVPLLIALVKQSGWSAQANALVAFACYIVVGVAAAATSGQPVTIENITAMITTATVVGSAAYKLIWSNIGTGQDGSAMSVEQRLTNATSIVK